MSAVACLCLTISQQSVGNMGVVLVACVALQRQVKRLKASPVAPNSLQIICGGDVVVPLELLKHPGACIRCTLMC